MTLLSRHGRQFFQGLASPQCKLDCYYYNDDRLRGEAFRMDRVLGHLWENCVLLEEYLDYILIVQIGEYQFGK